MERQQELSDSIVDAELRSAPFKRVLAYAYQTAQSSLQTRSMLASMPAETVSILESAAEQYACVSEEEAAEARSQTQVSFFPSNSLLVRERHYSWSVRSRIRTLFRAAAAWFPVLGGCAWLLVGRSVFCMGFRPSVSVPTAVCFLILLAGAIYAVIRPQRGIPDLIARTCIGLK